MFSKLEELCCKPSNAKFFEILQGAIYSVTVVPNRCLHSMFVGKSKGDCTSEVDQNLTS